MSIKLSEGEKNTPLWIKQKKYYEERLQILRAQNDSEKLTHEQTLVLRGQIKEVKAILNMDKDPPKFEQ